ncbi:hypothetical protein ABEB36_000227 [Hypothenemus hampei]|uniref:Uncharacterized protein n=1 Tax=Hypothenemus hampei TaxID=57062 RepID=A0ABD1FCF1_HYPHA
MQKFGGIFLVAKALISSGTLIIFSSTIGGGLGTVLVMPTGRSVSLLPLVSVSSFRPDVEYFVFVSVAVSALSLRRPARTHSVS